MFVGHIDPSIPITETFFPALWYDRSLANVVNEPSFVPLAAKHGLIYDAPEESWLRSREVEIGKRNILSRASQISKSWRSIFSGLGPNGFGRRSFLRINIYPYRKSIYLAGKNSRSVFGLFSPPSASPSVTMFSKFSRCIVNVSVDDAKIYMHKQSWCFACIGNGQINRMSVNYLSMFINVNRFWGWFNFEPRPFIGNKMSVAGLVSFLHRRQLSRKDDGRIPSEASGSYRGNTEDRIDQQGCPLEFAMWPLSLVTLCFVSRLQCAHPAVAYPVDSGLTRFSGWT